MGPVGTSAYLMRSSHITIAIWLVSKSRRSRLYMVGGVELPCSRIRLAKSKRELNFKVDDIVYLKVSPMRGVRRFNMKGKLGPKYNGPFRVLEKKGEVAYRLELPPNLSGVHDVFHVSQLKKCLRVPEEQASLEGLNIQEDLTYTEH
ncbi:hypothetical protein U9M48_043526 [Paspalum notatum var. saurae]|uniref:Tf2-1-like SH3-like domain-containing protein n=1 Tax=Paspalum notatum var. saurae TaxID=547442 RepID=A0AAQ3UTB0_PASNO